MIWNPLDILRKLIPEGADEAKKAARRWGRAFADEPALPHDLIRFAGILSLRAEEFDAETGAVLPTPIDPVRLAYEQGRRDMAVELLALGGISPFELNTMMTEPRHVQATYD